MVSSEFLWVTGYPGLLWLQLRYPECCSNSQSKKHLNQVHGSQLSGPLWAVCAHACSTVVSSQRLLNENSVWVDGLVTIWIMVKVCAAFQTWLVKGERERQKRGDKWDEHSSWWTKAPLHALLVLLWGGKLGWKPQVVPEKCQLTNIRKWSVCTSMH